MSPVTLPVSLPSARAWQLADFATARAVSEPATGGQARVLLEQLDSDELWLIDHAVIACSSSAATTLRLFEDIATDLNLLDGSASGNFDVADWPAGLQVQPSRALLAVWSDASDGAVATITLQLRRYRRA